MPWNIYKPRGAAKGNEITSGSAVPQAAPKFGVVKDNIDPLRCGRLRVYVEGMSGLNPDDADSWITVQYMSPFYGQTLATASNSGYGDFKTNTHSYGFWTQPPDIGTTVVLLFINGDPNYGVWIGSIPEPAHLQMVPAIGAAIPGVKIVPNAGEAEKLGGATRLPAVNVNSNNTEWMRSTRFLTEARPVHSYNASILFQQGLIRDPLRGVIGSSAQREAPSRVMGISTPGRPIYAGGYTDENIAKTVTNDKTPPESLKVISRRGGHSLVMDDGDIIGRDQMIRLRTALGHQILMSDDGQCLFIIHSNGKSWIELGKEGTIDMFSTNSVNIRTVGDLNLHADNNINMFAKNAINMSTETLTTESSKDTRMRSGGDYTAQVVGKYTVKVGGAMSMASTGEGSYYSDSTMYINGKRINLNTGQAGTVPQAVKPLPIVVHTDTLFDKSKGWLAAPGKLPSIVSRAPAHTPWDAAGSGVPVKVELNADNALPAGAQPAVSTAQNTAQSTAGTPAGASTAAARTVGSNPVSKAIGKAETATAVASQAAQAATGPAAAAAQKGGGIAEVGGTKIPVVGKASPLTPQQIEAAGAMKAGASVLAQGLAQAGKTVEQAMPPNLFTGVPGAETAQALAKNATAQADIVVKNLQNAQAGLQAAGVITGRESGSQILGTVMAAATNGVANTVNFIKSAAGNLGNVVSGTLGGATAALGGAFTGAAGAVTSAVTNMTSKITGGIGQMMNLGNKAAGLAGGLGGGLSALSSNLQGMAAQFGKTASDLFETAKGTAANAFNALKNALPTLKAGVPQDVKAIAETAAQKAQSGVDIAGSGLKLPGGASIPKLGDGVASLAGQLGNVASVVDSARATASGALGSATNSFAGAAAAVNTAVGGIANNVLNVAGTVNKVGLDASKFIATGSGVASGINLLPGGVGSLGAIANNFGQGLSVAGGIATDAVQQLGTGLNTGLNQISSAITMTKTNISGLTDGIQNASNLLSSGIPKLGGDPAATIGVGLQNLTGSLGGLKNQIANAGGSLKDLALKGLPPAAAGQLQGAIAGLASGDGVVSLPIIAKDTADFGAAVDSAVAEITGPGISQPNFNGNPATLGESEADKILQKTAAFNSAVASTASDISKTNTDIANAAQKLATATATLPEGAPQIADAKKTLDNVVGDGLKLANQANTLLSSANTAIGAIRKFPPG